jgi:hypothetical protein
MIMIDENALLGFALLVFALLGFALLGFALLGFALLGFARRARYLDPSGFKSP